MRTKPLLLVSFLTLILIGSTIVAVPTVESVHPSTSQSHTPLVETIPPLQETKVIEESKPADEQSSETAIVEEPQLPDVPSPEIETALAEEPELPTTPKSETPVVEEKDNKTISTVPFFSQFSDISAPAWKKVGCGIASLAMLIDFYEPGVVDVDELLEKGIRAHAYQEDAGWTYAGLIGLSVGFGLTGETHDFGGFTNEEAYKNFKKDLEEGPLMASVHYTFEPTNPIPHLVVITGLKDGLIYYNDPADKSGGNSLDEKTFQRAWKKRYIEIRPL